MTYSRRDAHWPHGSQVMAWFVSLVFLRGCRLASGPRILSIFAPIVRPKLLV
jgi:hypothetical protein